MSSKEQRRHPRFKVNRTGRIRIGDDAPSLTHLVNISEAGAALFYSGPVARDTAVELSFRLNIGTDAKPLLTLQGRVRHSEMRGHSYLLGIEFSNPPAQAIETIRKFVDYNKLSAE